MTSPFDLQNVNAARERWIGQPLDLGADLQAEIANTRHLVGILRDRGNLARASAVGEYVHDLLDRTLTAKVTGPVACAKGCHHCCHTYVSATIPEILRLAQVVRASGRGVEDIAVAAARSKEIGQEQRFLNRVSCPLLDDGMCGGYGGRPLACRTMLSRSLDACLRYFPLNGSGALDYAPGSREARGRVEIILLAALSLAGLPQEHIELTQGLSIALAHPDAEERWLAGEPVFAGVAADTAEGHNDALATWVPILAAAVRPLL
ncbi:MAG: YkgJ family cysteine cluster protein [Rhodospirillaceae bacterium]